MTRRRVLAAAGALVLLLALAAVVPRGDDRGGSLQTSSDDPVGTTTVGWTRVTPAMRAEIARVVAGDRWTLRTKGGYLAAARQLVRCADLAGQRYCLGVGWTEDSESQVQARVAADARQAAGTDAAGTGDLSTAATLERRARMSPAARARSDRAELLQAARSVGKVWALRHDLEGTTIPAGVLRQVPALRTSVAARTKRPSDYPERSVILKHLATRSQSRTYWCGPTAMQTIAHGYFRPQFRSQRYWAEQLHTTRDGTSISDMVRTVNAATGWDSTSYAGPYVVLDVGHYSYRQWILLIMRHIQDYRAPVVLHPVLLKRFFPYLDDDASGHYQVGRGYDKNGTKPALLGYFEPWNQQRFDPSEPAIARVQWRNAYRSYRANRVHEQHDIGV